MAGKKSGRFSNSIRIENRKAFFEYEIVEKFEAGIVLTGCEVKSLREGGGSLADVWAQPMGGELFLKNMHINPYIQGDDRQVPYRDRKLLLRKTEINRLLGSVSRKGLTIIPLTVFFNAKGLVKVSIALCRGKAAHDKRETIKRREQDREMRRDFKEHR